MVLEISSESYLIQVNPDEGGRVERFTYSRGEEILDIFRPKPEQNFEQDGVPLYGSFVMLPFCNRLSPEIVLTSNGPLTVPTNWTEESCAIHGLGLSEAWSPVDVRKNSCHLSTTLKSREGKCVGIGILEFEVSDKYGFLSRVGFCNTRFDWILAGLGFHPWFNLGTGDAYLEIFAEGKFKTDSKLLPTSYNELGNKEFILSSTLNNGMDSCFSGWDGRSRLALDQYDFILEISSTANNLHVYINKNLDAICVEPVSHVTNAMHDQRWNGFAGMKKVHHGETIWLDMNITVQMQPIIPKTKSEPF